MQATAIQKQQTHKNMALGRQTEDRGELIVLDLKLTDENKKPIKPEFIIRKKSPETGKYESQGTCTSFSGRLKSVQTKVKEFKRDNVVIDSKEVVDLYFEDGDETYLLPLSYNIANRGIYNRLLNLDTFLNLEVNCWRDDRGFSVLTLRQNGQSVKGKFSREQIPVPTEVTFKGKIQRDYSEVDKFFKDELIKLSERIRGYVQKSEVKATASVEAEDKTEIPF